MLLFETEMKITVNIPQEESLTSDQPNQSIERSLRLSPYLRKWWRSISFRRNRRLIGIVHILF